MDFQELLRIYSAHHIIEIDKEQAISDWRIEKMRRVLARVEIRTTLYGEKVKIYHEMAYNPDGKIVPRYFGPPIRKHRRNWLASFYMIVLIVYYQTELPPLGSVKSTFDLKTIPYIDETKLTISESTEAQTAGVVAPMNSWRNRGKQHLDSDTDKFRHFRLRRRAKV